MYFMYVSKIELLSIMSKNDYCYSQNKRTHSSISIIKKKPVWFVWVNTKGNQKYINYKMSELKNCNFPSVLNWKNRGVVATMDLFQKEYEEKITNK